MENTLEFCKNDFMMKEFYNEYVVNKVVPSKDEIIMNLNFFATMSIQCKRHELPELGKIYSQRLDAFYYIMSVIGYKFGRKLSGSSEPGLSSILTKAFYNLGGDE